MIRRLIAAKRFLLRNVEFRVPAKTISTFLAAPLDEGGNAVALRFFEESRWQTTAKGAFARSVRELAAGLDDLGVELGGRVAVLAPSSPGAWVAELAVQSIGAATVPIDPTLRSAQLGRILRRTEPRQIFVCDLIQLDRVLEIRPELPSLDLVLLLRSPGGDEVAAATHVDTVCAMGAGRLRADPRLLDGLLRRVAPETPAYVLPAETTGERTDFEPSQDHLVRAAEALGAALSIRSNDTILAAVPGSRSSHRALRLLSLCRGAEFVFARPEDGSLAQDLAETQPTVLLAERKSVESLAATAQGAIRARSSPLRSAYEWAFGLGGGRTLGDLAGDHPAPARWNLRIADAALLAPYRRKLVGRRLRRIVSLGPPLAEETRSFFAALGIAVFEGEDCSATSGILALNTPQAFRPGTLGHLLPGIEGRRDGAELLVRGPVGDEWLSSGRRLHVDREGWVVPTE